MKIGCFTKTPILAGVVNCTEVDLLEILQIEHRKLVCRLGFREGGSLRRANFRHVQVDVAVLHPHAQVVALLGQFLEVRVDIVIDVFRRELGLGNLEFRCLVRSVGVALGRLMARQIDGDAAVLTNSFVCLLRQNISRHRDRQIVWAGEVLVRPRQCRPCLAVFPHRNQVSQFGWAGITFDLLGHQLHLIG